MGIPPKVRSYGYAKIFSLCYSFEWLSVENVLSLSDSFNSCYRDDMALFKIEADFPFFCPFVECV